MKFEFRNESLKSKFSLILFVYNLMIRYSKKKIKKLKKIIQENAFVKKKKKPGLKFNPRFALWLSTMNWAKLPVISLLWRLWYPGTFFLVYPFSIHLINLNFRLSHNIITIITTLIGVYSVCSDCSKAN